jgi:hypothetical protein
VLRCSSGGWITGLTSPVLVGLSPHNVRIDIFPIFDAWLNGQAPEWVGSIHTSPKRHGNVATRRCGAIDLRSVHRAVLVDVACEAPHPVSPVRKSDGTVWAWGSYYAGALGNGTDVYTYPGITGADVPVQVTGLSGVTSIGSGSATVYAIVGQ